MDNQLEPRDTEQLSASFELAKDIITRDYLYNLSKMEVCELPEALRDVHIADFTRLFHFERFISDKNENMLDKLVTVLSAAYTSKSSVITIIKGNRDRTDYYIGVVNKSLSNDSDISVQGATFESALKGNFPGLKATQITDTELESLCENIFIQDVDGNIAEGTVVSSVSGIASIRDEKGKSLNVAKSIDL